VERVDSKNDRDKNETRVNEFRGRKTSEITRRRPKTPRLPSNSILIDPYYFIASPTTTTRYKSHATVADITTNQKRETLDQPRAVFAETA